MSYAVFLQRPAEKEVEALPQELHDRIFERILALKENPRPHGVKKLRARDGYRIRVGDYRVVYVIDDPAKKIEIHSIAHRKDVYRR